MGCGPLKLVFAAWAITYLKEGLKFAPAPRYVPYKEMIAAVENGLQRLSEKDAASVRPRIIGILSQSKLPVSNLSATERRAIKQLRDDDDILILPADKGQSTVIMDRCEYNRKVQLM